MTDLLNRFSESLAASWRGYERLWIVFWIYYIPVGIALQVALENPPIEWYVWVPLTLVSLVWLIWVTVSLWRCAYGTDYRILGHLVRLNVFVALIIFVFDVVLILIAVIAS